MKGVKFRWFLQGGKQERVVCAYFNKISASMATQTMTTMVMISTESLNMNGIFVRFIAFTHIIINTDCHHQPKWPSVRLSVVKNGVLRFNQYRRKVLPRECFMAERGLFTP